MSSGEGRRGQGEGRTARLGLDNRAVPTTGTGGLRYGRETRLG